MKLLVLDTECTCLRLHPTKLNGNPFARKNSLTYVGCRTDEGSYYDYSIEYQDRGYGDNLLFIQELIDEHDIIIGFNIKFDIHWLHRYGIKTSHKRVYDAQLAEFLFSNQSIPYPSLAGVTSHYGLEGKLDVVKDEYWSQGIDTDNIPEDVIRTYLKQDVMQTWEVYKAQQQHVTPANRVLLSLCFQDLQALQTIEENGLLFDTNTSINMGDEVQEELKAIDLKMKEFVDVDCFNPDSGDHLSAVLYGGVIKWVEKEEYTFKYKDGREAQKLRNVVREKEMPRLVSPLKGSALAKEGYYATNEATLSSLPAKGAVKRLLGLVLDRSKKEKLRGTYLHGLPAMIEKNDWDGGYIHGQFNQTVAITGRLSSSKPNQQNMSKEINNLFITRYPV